MKKTLKLIVLMAAIVLSFAACGTEKTEPDTNPVPAETQQEEEVNTEANAEVAAYVEANREVVKAATEEGFYIALEARGDAVVYIFRYENIKNSPELATALEAEHKNNESTFTDVLTGMKAECPAVGSVIYEYLDSEGELIYSFTAK